MKKRLMLTMLTGLSIAAGHVQADDVIRQDFDKVADKNLPTDASPLGKTWAWTGPEQFEFGHMDVVADHTETGKGKCVAIFNAEHTDTHAPVFVIDWHETPLSMSSDAYTVEYSFMVPTAPPFLSCAFFGQGWDDASLIIGMEDGNIAAIYGEGGDGGKRQSIGKYQLNKWVHMKAQIDPDKKLASLWIDGKKVANNLPLRPQGKAVAAVNICASNKPVSDTDKPVMYVDDIVVQSVAAK